MYFMRAAPKSMPPLLLCCPMTSETDAGGMAADVEPSQQYYVLLWHDRWQHRDSLTQ